MKNNRKTFRNLRLIAGISLVILALLVANVPSPYRGEELNNNMGLPDLIASGTEGTTESSAGTEVTGTESTEASGSTESGTENTGSGTENTESDTASTESESGEGTGTEKNSETEAATETETGQKPEEYDARTINVSDNRTDTEKGKKTTASVPKTYVKTVYLRIESSNGNLIKPLINTDLGYDKISPFTMILATEETGGTVVSDFGERCTVTMVPPDDFAAREKDISLYTVDTDGTLEKVYTVSASTTSGETYLMFSTDHMGEYAFVLNEKEKQSLPTEDNRIDKVGTVSSSIIWETAEVEGSKLLVEEDAGTGVQPIVEGTEEFSTASEISSYDLSLVDSEENAIKDDSIYRVYIHMPLPKSMPLDSGEVSAVYTYVQQTDGSIKAEKADIIETGVANGISYVEFVTDHFSVYSVFYAEKTSADTGGTDSGGTDSGGTYGGDNEAGGTGGSSHGGGNKGGGNNNGGGGNNGGNNNGGSGNNGGNTNNAAATPATPASTQSAAPAASTQAAAPTQAATSTQATPSTQQSTTSGNTTSGSVDMPKTGDMTTYRMIMVILLFVGGLLLLITCIPVKIRKNKEY